MESYLNAFNDANPDVLAQFVARGFTPEGPGGADIATRTRSQARLQKSSGGIDLYAVEPQENAISIVGRFRLTHEWRRMTFMMEPTAPHRISGIMIVPEEAPAVEHAVPVSNEALAEELGAFVDRLVAADQFSGVVLVARDGEILFERAYGTADREAGIPNHLDTRFGYASVGKMFTAVAIAQLSEAGLVAYDQPIATYLPRYAGEVAGAVTIDQLLTHRSGIPDYFEEAARFPELDANEDPVRAFVDRVMQEQTHFKPGERFEYSNTNYALLGLVVEKLSGTSFADYLRTQIFEPAGMNQTTLSVPTASGSEPAWGYTQVQEDGQIGTGPRTRFDGGHGTGGAFGGGYTTAADLLRFDRALREHRLVGPESTASLFRGRVDEGRPGYRYGYGFMERSAGGNRIVGHSGGFPGIDAQFDMYLGSGHTVIVLSNYELVAEPIISFVQERV